MTSFKVELAPGIAAELRAVPFPFRRELGHAIVEFQREARPRRSQALIAELRVLPVHGWRIIYSGDEDAALVLVHHIVKLP